ncbi:ATP-citrate synthase [Mycena sanguinolenta]|uniref:ATP citrate synthase n=1 Tax=Mycena sanguinolenta TaxID=230812 RepID=A0A8H6YSU6_9AGAR|nr:ATP-citrate synthase [Mycena sanguinolenta]
MRLLGESLGILIKVYNPDTHITDIVPIALGIGLFEQGSCCARSRPEHDRAAASPIEMICSSGKRTQPNDQIVHFDTSRSGSSHPAYRPFDSTMRSFVYRLEPRVIQGMLEFEYSYGLRMPSMMAMIYPFGDTPSRISTGERRRFCLCTPASTSRSVYSSTLEIFVTNLQHRDHRKFGVPKRHARKLPWLAKEVGMLVIGPATVGGIKPGCFSIGNSGSMMDNIIASKLYHASSVGYVSKSGGMSNELNNILSLMMNGMYEGIAIGGDRYPGSTFIDHLLRYEADPQCKMLVLLGEVGASAIGTCAKMFDMEVQFGHTRSMADSEMETADAKNKVMHAAGFVVPETFKELLHVLEETYENLVKKGVVVPKAEMDPPVIPMYYKWAQELGLICKPTVAFIFTIGDECGQELVCPGMRISDVFKEDIGLSGVASLPTWATKFIEMVLMLTTDHSPTVSGYVQVLYPARTLLRSITPSSRRAQGKI